MERQETGSSSAGMAEAPGPVQLRPAPPWGITPQFFLSYAQKEPGASHFPPAPCGCRPEAGHRPSKPGTRVRVPSSAPISGCGAVGSARDLGSRGPGFESQHSDQYLGGRQDPKPGGKIKKKGSESTLSLCINIILWNPNGAGARPKNLQKKVRCASFSDTRPAGGERQANL